MMPALEMVNVRRALRGAPVLDGLDLRVEPGRCRALVGLNGSGKTTALRIALGMLRQDEGTVRVLGHDVGAAPARTWAQVGHLVETPFSYPELTARENVIASARLHGMTSRSAASAVQEIAAPLQLIRWLDVAVRRLSLGTRQKVGLAAALVHRPRLAILDEPTNGLDPMAVLGLREVVASLVDDGAAVLVTGHHFDEIARMADRVEVLHGGRVVGALRPDGGDLESRFFATVLAAERGAA